MYLLLDCVVQYFKCFYLCFQRNQIIKSNKKTSKRNNKNNNKNRNRKIGEIIDLIHLKLKVLDNSNNTARQEN